MLEKTIILDGFSKTYAMTGWRMGYGVMPEWLVDAVNKLMVNSNSCTASFTQRAGIAALTGPQDCVDAMVAEFRRRRDVIVAGLNQIPGLPLPAARRRLLRLPQRHRHRHEFQGTRRFPAVRSRRRLPEWRHRFGEYGDGYIRFSYANSLENLMEAVARIRKVSTHWQAAVAAR